MRVEILTSTPEIESQMQIVERAGRVCYQSYKEPVTIYTARKFIAMLIKRGHESVLEHGSITVLFGGVSRGMTHELVRHRVGVAYSQESTRYVDEQAAQFALPPRLENSPRARELMTQALGAYRELRALGVTKEDARQFLPIGMENQIVVTANFRAWRHIIAQRTARAAHWEIRQALVRLVEQLRPIVSPVFDEFIFDTVCASGVPFSCFSKV
ncbi:MAG: FAD-dependent thymidylate synthase [Patescibacteria group bacterium]